MHMIYCIIMLLRAVLGFRMFFEKRREIIAHSVACSMFLILVAVREIGIVVAAVLVVTRVCGHDRNRTRCIACSVIVIYHEARRMLSVDDAHYLFRRALPIKVGDQLVACGI